MSFSLARFSLEVRCKHPSTSLPITDFRKTLIVR